MIRTIFPLPNQDKVKHIVGLRKAACKPRQKLLRLLWSGDTHLCQEICQTLARGKRLGHDRQHSQSRVNRLQVLAHRGLEIESRPFAALGRVIGIVLAVELMRRPLIPKRRKATARTNQIGVGISIDQHEHKRAPHLITTAVSAAVRPLPRAMLTADSSTAFNFCSSNSACSCACRPATRSRSRSRRTSLYCLASAPSWSLRTYIESPRQQVPSSRRFKGTGRQTTFCFILLSAWTRNWSRKTENPSEISVIVATNSLGRPRAGHQPEMRMVEGEDAVLDQLLPIMQHGSWGTQPTRMTGGCTASTRACWTQTRGGAVMGLVDWLVIDAGTFPFAAA